MSKSISRRVPLPRHRWHTLPFTLGNRNGYTVAVFDCLCLECGLLRRKVSRGVAYPLFQSVRYFRNGVDQGGLAPECPGESLRHHV